MHCCVHKPGVGTFSELTADGSTLEERELQWLLQLWTFVCSCVFDFTLCDYD